MGKVRKVYEMARNHVVDSTALLVSTNPICSAMEVGIAGMSDDVSIDSRIAVAGLTYAGMGFAFAKGRDLSRRVFGIGGKTAEKIQTFHDAAYTAGFNLAIIPFIYASQGASVRESIVGGLSAAAMSTVIGPVMGYSIDAARDLTGLQECQRPSYKKIGIKNGSRNFKKGLAGLLIAGSIAAMAGVYTLNPDEEIDPSKQIPVVEEILEEE